MGLGQGGEEWGWSTVCKIYDVRKLTHWYKIQDLYTFICALYEYFYLMLRCTIFSDVYMKYSTMQSLKTRRSSSTDNCTTYVRRYFLRIDFVPSHVICLVHFIRKKKKLVQICQVNKYNLSFSFQKYHFIPMFKNQGNNLRLDWSPDIPSREQSIWK